MPKSFIDFAIEQFKSIFPRPTDANLNRLVQLLVENTKSSNDQPSFDILAIIGMVGSGKTTLADNIYNHHAIKKHFSSRAWVELSQLSDPLAVFLEILSQTAVGNNTDMGGFALDQLVSSLKNVLRGKRCMLVLDDVWGFESLSVILPFLVYVGFNKIVITSRNYDLYPESENPFRWFYHDMRCLSEDDSWKLFEKLVCKNGRGLDLRHRELAIDTLRKCEGLPLAIVALVHLVKTKETIEEWKTEFSRIKSSGEEGTCLLYTFMKDKLEKSYDKLPEYLKPCFLYLGLFPADSSISAGKLMRMSMAEEFFDGYQDDNMTLEEEARRWVQKLIDHTMVQIVRRNYAGEVKTVRVHNIMRHLCITKAREFGFLAVVSSNSEATSTSSQQATNNISRNFQLPTQNSHLKSLVLSGQFSTTAEVNGHTHTQGNQATFDIAPIYRNFKLLRVLEISGIKAADGTLPRNIGSLTQLRYLRIRSTNVHKLPKSIRKLSNLLTLDYRDVCPSVGVEVPNVLSGLKRLRHLFLPTELNILTGGLKLHSLKNLQTLWGVRGENWTVREMRSLSSSLRKLYVVGISCPKQLDEILDCPIIKTHDNLRVLALDWHGFELASLEAICWKDSLQKLRLSGKTTDKLNPILVPSSLQKLQLYYTRLQNPETMSALGRLPCLKHLKLSKLSFIGSQWTCDREAFPQLEELHLSNLQSLERWNIVIGTMPFLKKLSIVLCTKLCRIPEALKFIHTLEKLEIDGMPPSFCSKLQKAKGHRADGTGQDFHIIRHIPDIQIRNVV